MRQLTAVLGVVAIVACAAGPAQAQSYTLPYFPIDSGFFTYNLFNSPLENPPPAQQANWQNPYATMRGAIWTNTGSGPVLATAAINMEFWVNDYDNEWGSGGDGTGGADGWLLEQRALLSDGGATNDMIAGDAGAFDADSSGTGRARDLLGGLLDRRGPNGHPVSVPPLRLDRHRNNLRGGTGGRRLHGRRHLDPKRCQSGCWIAGARPAPNTRGHEQPGDNPGEFPGDANHDGTVDINDLTIVLAHYGTSGSPLNVTNSEGDFNGDGKVDINDLTIVLAHYNQTIGASAAGIAPVPEPSAVVLFGVAVIGLLAFGRGRKAKALTSEAI